MIPPLPLTEALEYVIVEGKSDKSINIWMSFRANAASHITDAKYHILGNCSICIMILNETQLCHGLSYVIPHHHNT